LQPLRNAVVCPCVAWNVGVQLDVGDPAKLLQKIESIGSESSVKASSPFIGERRYQARFDPARKGRLGEQDQDGPPGKIVD
jgi:hypothetical protein